MSFLNIEQHEVLQYAAAVQMVAQQTMNPLQNAVTKVSASGEAQSVADLIDAVEYQRGEENNFRNTETPISGSRRWVSLQPEIKASRHITNEDKFRRAADPTSQYVRAFTMGVNRGCADIALGISKVGSTFSVTDGGILGVAKEGKSPGSGTALPASQYISHSSLGMSLDKLIAAREMLKLADFGLEENMDELFCAITPKQETDLLNIAAEAKVALNAFQIEQLRDGKPTKLMGVTWIISTRLPFKAGSTTTRLCPIWAKSNIIYAEWRPIRGRIWNDTSADLLPFAKVDTVADCVRAQDKGVVVIECSEA